MRRREWEFYWPLGIRYRLFFLLVPGFIIKKTWSNVVWRKIVIMAYTLSPELEADLRSLCKDFRVRDLKLCGSGVGDDFDPETSDLDFVVEIDEPPVGMRLASQYFDFLDGLLNLLGKEVDLLEGSAIENPYLKSIVYENAIGLYAA